MVTISGYDTNGKYRRLRFHAENMEKATLIAKQLLNSSEDSPYSFEISDILLKPYEISNWKEKTKKDTLASCKPFLYWVDRKKLVYWRELRHHHIQEFFVYLKNEKKYSYNTVRLYMLPVRRATKWAINNYPKEFNNICDGIRIAEKDFSSRMIDEIKHNPFLSIPHVVDFIKYLQYDIKKINLAIGVALQGLMGLQLQEATRLEWNKVDLEKGTIKIEGEVKNQSRIRKIPLVSVVKNLLKEVKVQKGKIIKGFKDYDAYSRAVKREYKKWSLCMKEKHPDLPKNLNTKDFRNTILTESIDGGWDGFHVERYVGHAATDITGKHYYSNEPDRLVERFREKVVQHIEENISRWNGNSEVSFGSDVAQNQQSDCTFIARCKTNEDNNPGEEVVKPVLSVGCKTRREGLEPPTA